MRKIISILLIGLMAFSLFGCDKKAEKSSNSGDSDKVETVSDTAPISVDDIPVIFTIENDNMYASYTNNSNKTITACQIITSVKGSSKKTYFNSEDTVEPGKNSPKFEADGPKATNKDDIEVVRYYISFINDKGTENYLKYSCKTKKYILTSTKEE